MAATFSVLVLILSSSTYLRSAKHSFPLLYLKDVGIPWGKISNCFITTLMNLKFFFKNILKTKCNSVRKKAFLFFLAHFYTTLNIKKKLHIDQKYLKTL